MLNQDSEIVICSRFVNCELWSCDMNLTLGSVVPLKMFWQNISEVEGDDAYNGQIRLMVSRRVVMVPRVLGGNLSWMRMRGIFACSTHSSQSSTQHRWSWASPEKCDNLDWQDHNQGVQYQHRDLFPLWSRPLLVVVRGLAAEYCFLRKESFFLVLLCTTFLILVLGIITDRVKVTKVGVKVAYTHAVWDSQQCLPPDRCEFPIWPSQQSSSSECPGSPWYFVCREFVQNSSMLICHLNYFLKLHLVRSLEASVAFSLAAAPAFPLRPMWPRKPLQENGWLGQKGGES